jgi:glycosyltransferase involved in cell wall biosynthesis
MSFTWEREPIRTAPLSVVVTVPTAAGALEPTLDPLLNHLKRLGNDFEVLVCPEGGPEGRPAVSEGLTAVTVVTPEKPGHGAALKAGLKAARHPLVFTFPATGEYDAADLAQFLERIDRCDLVCGIRRGLSRWTRWRWGFWPYLLFGVSVRDATCPVRLYRREIFKRIPIQSSSGFAEVEILAKANFLERIFDEVEIAWKPGPVSVDRGTARDLRRLFNHPDFGPVDPDAVAAQATSPTSA